MNIQNFSPILVVGAVSLILTVPFRFFSLNDSLRVIIDYFVSLSIIGSVFYTILLFIDLTFLKRLILGFSIPIFLLVGAWTWDFLWPVKGQLVNIPRSYIFMFPGELIIRFFDDARIEGKLIKK